MSKKYYVPTPSNPQTAKTGTFRAVSLESEAIIQRVSKDLYANPASGVREILANEIRAAIKAKELGANPRIEVTVTDDTVRVWGIDSLGMEREIFDTVYMTLGRSSNFDGKTPGQFGLGRAAYMTISDHMLLETNCRNGDCYSVLGVEGRGYQTGLPEPSIPYGTRITMAPRHNAGIGMRTMVRDTAKRSPIPIRLITETGTEDLEREDMAEAHVIHASLEDVELGAFRKDGSDSVSYLCGMPVNFTYRGQYNLKSITVDIHDERKYPPTPDRERMTEKAEVVISALIDGVARERLKDFPRDTAKAMAHPDRLLAFTVLGGSELPGLDDYYPNYDTGYARCLGTLPGSPVINCKAFDTRRIEAVKAVFPHAEFVKNAPFLPDLGEFMKAHDIKTARPRAERRKDITVALHTNKGVIRTDPQDPPTDRTIYKVPNGQALKDNYAVTRETDTALTIHNVRGAVSLESVMAEARQHTFITSRGMMTGQEILDSGLEAAPTVRETLLDCWGALKNGPKLLVLSDYSGHYRVLRWQSSNLHYGLWVRNWENNAHAMETYLRLENEIHKDLMMACRHSHVPKFCDAFMEMENKEPLRHNPDCDCPACEFR